MKKIFILLFFTFTAIFVSRADENEFSESTSGFETSYAISYNDSIIKVSGEGVSKASSVELAYAYAFYKVMTKIQSVLNSKITKIITQHSDSSLNENFLQWYKFSIPCDDVQVIELDRTDNVDGNKYEVNIRVQYVLSIDQLIRSYKHSAEISNAIDELW